MRSDRNNRDHLLVWAVEPEYPVGRRGLILGIGLEDFFAVRAGQGAELVGVEAGVTGIHLQVAECLANGLEALAEARVGLKRAQVGFSLRGKSKGEGHELLVLIDVGGKAAQRTRLAFCSLSESGFHRAKGCSVLE